MAKEKIAEMSKEGLTKPDIPRTLTIKDIHRLYGISRYKIFGFMREQNFPLPLKGFTRPFRWLAEDVERFINRARKA